MKNEKANKHDIGKKCSTNYDDNNNSNNNDTILDSENPFDVYDDEDIINAYNSTWCHNEYFCRIVDNISLKFMPLYFDTELQPSLNPRRSP